MSFYVLHRIARKRQCTYNSRISGLMLRTDNCLLLHKVSRCSMFQSLFTEAVFNIMLNKWIKTNKFSQSARFDVISHYICTSTKQLDLGSETCIWQIPILDLARNANCIH